MNRLETIIVVDDEPNYLFVMQTLLTEEGFNVLTAERGEAALDLVNRDVDLILTDMTMPGMGGIELLRQVKEINPDLPVIMMTAFGTVEKAVEAMKIGAYDYITKPFKNDELMMTVRKALEMGRLKRENEQLNQALKERFSFGSIIGKSKPMLEIYRLIEKVADTRANVLVTGESGTGKELIAKAVHYESPRANGPFVAVNCSALAESLLESELFGHEKGAFTDAKAMRKGRFESANNGTLFLDEIGEMALGLQAKLLRVLQERTFERVGGNESISVDFRLVAATNRDLKEEVAKKRFREDLFYRLNVVHIHVPPLRDRTDDIPLLVGHFIKKFSRESGRASDLKLSPAALRKVFSYSWPGNVRELENVIERSVILCSGDTVQPDDFPEEMKGPLQSDNADDLQRDGKKSDVADYVDIDNIPQHVGLNELLDAVEYDMLMWALEQTDQVQAHAAELLGITKTTMHNKMNKYKPGPESRIPKIKVDTGNIALPGRKLNDVLDEVEKKIIMDALEKSGGIQARAADLLGMNKKTIQYKMSKFDKP